MLTRARYDDQRDLPLLPLEDSGQPVARCDNGLVDRTQFVTAVTALAKALPHRPQVINYCTDRYEFIVSLAAAMVRGQITHLPHDRTAHALAHLIETYPQIYCIVDTGPAPDGIDCVRTNAHTADGPIVQDVPRFPEDQVAAYVYTGGTTGRPTPNVKTWGTLVDGSCRIAKSIGLGDHPGATILATVPAQHMYGLEHSVILPLAEGVTVDARKPLFPVDVERCAREIEGDVILITTPVHLKALVASRVKLPGLVKIVSATAPLSATLACAAEEVLGAPVIEIYGCSEAGSIASRRTTAGPRWKTLDGLTLDKRADGWVAHVPYLPAPVPLQDIIETVSPTEFELRGRTNEMVNVAGKRASLSGLNTILNDIPGVRDGVFVCSNAPDNTRDEAVSRLTAFVVAPNLGAAEIQRLLREKIDPAFLPRPLHIVDALPRNEAGKLTKSALVQLVRDMENKGQ